MGCYPDSTGSGDVVRYAYNRLGQQTGLLDQAGNQINTSYDLLGRETARAVTTLASGFDGSVRRVELAYLSRGPVSTVTQYDAATSGNVTDQVQYEYDGWGNLTHFHQDVDSAMSSPGTSASGRSAFTVQHDLTKSAPTGGVHALRRTATYSKAGGTTFHQVGYAYGSATINDYASRVASVTVGSSPTTVATYDYLGAGHLVGTTLDQANLNTSVFAESGGTHTYSDLDRFNRPTRWNWERVGGASGGFYNTAIAYDENSNPVSTTDDAHARNNSSDHPFDVVYGLDSLNRVISADEGNIDAGAIESGTRTRKELWNSLSLTGNWGNRQLDANGDGDFGDEADRDEPSAYNTFNRANEWTARRVAKASGSDRDEHAYTYDAVGNLTDLVATVYRGGNTALTHRRLVYDAFGRLVRVAAVEGMDETDVALYRYNGLNMRLMWHDDADADSTLESSERFYVMFDERWRPAATFRDADATPKEAFVWHAAGQGGFGGSSYIDSLILRDRDNYTGGTPNPMTSASDGTLEERRYFCQNWRADVVAVTKSDGTPLEYVRYSPYGEPTVYPVADLNMDGVVNSTDSTLWSDLLYSTSNASVYAGTDLDFDGADDWNSGGADGDLFYESYTANTGLSGVGRMSSPSVGNRVGYAGYQWDGTLSACHVRYRVYLPDIGRWTRRDPLGYVPQVSLYSYCGQSSVRWTDAMGLMTGEEIERELERIRRLLDSPWVPESEKARLRALEAELQRMWTPQASPSNPSGPFDYDWLSRPGACDDIKEALGWAGEEAKETLDALTDALLPSGLVLPAQLLPLLRPGPKDSGPSECRMLTDDELRKIGAKSHWKKPRGNREQPIGIWIDKEGKLWYGPKEPSPGQRAIRFVRAPDGKGCFRIPTRLRKTIRF